MGTEGLDFLFKVFRAIEGLVDRREAQVRDFIEVSQWIEDSESDLVGLHQ